ncbi:proteasome subunit alpha [Armatimonas sp.]|uniref:proteasome subunit alpha n=1 Tax=Armatimonas sp. TaxID=1872638 RepID=UPI0037506929
MTDLLQPHSGNFAALTGFQLNGLAEGPIHGTTVIAVKYKDGVLTVGDRRATGGMAIMYDKAEKVLSLDDYTLISISGSFSKAIELVRYLRMAFKYYERSQLQAMSLDGKLNELGKLIAGNMVAAMQGIGLVIPILTTFDKAKNEGRVFFYDGGGARFETAEYAAAGSGSTQIRGAFEYIGRTKGPFREMDRDTALREVLTLLEIAADLDAATGGSSKYLPLAKTITAEGIADIEEDVLRAIVKTTLTAEPAMVQG